jgi:hypothetical protein
VEGQELKDVVGILKEKLNLEIEVDVLEEADDGYLKLLAHPAANPTLKDRDNFVIVLHS